jgi:hypothetical protein
MTRFSWTTEQTEKSTFTYHNPERRENPMDMALPRRSSASGTDPAVSDPRMRSSASGGNNVAMPQGIGMDSRDKDRIGGAFDEHKGEAQEKLRDKVSDSVKKATS